MERPRVPGSVSRRGDRYLAQLPPSAGRRSRVVASEEAAWAWLAAEDARRRLGMPAEARGDALTLGEIAELWIGRAFLKDSTREDYRYKLRRHILAHPASKVTELMPAHVDDVLMECPPNHTRAKVAGILDVMLRWAEDNELIASNPYRRSQARAILRAIDPPRREAIQNTWTAEQFVSFIRDEGDPVYRVLWVFYACTGARRGEALGLTAEQVDLDAGSAWLVHNITRAGNRIAVVASPKNGRRRKVYFGPAVAAALGPLCKRADPWVFQHRGKHLNPQTVTARFNRQADRLGLPRLAGPHGLRRTFSTLADMEGFRPAVRSTALGHTPDLLGRYTKATEVELRDLALRLEGLLCE